MFSLKRPLGWFAISVCGCVVPSVVDRNQEIWRLLVEEHIAKNLEKKTKNPLFLRLKDFFKFWKKKNSFQVLSWWTSLLCIVGTALPSVDNLGSILSHRACVWSHQLKKAYSPNLLVKPPQQHVAFPSSGLLNGNVMEIIQAVLKQSLREIISNILFIQQCR